MYYIDTDVLIHFLVNQNSSLHSQVKILLRQFVKEGNLSLSWLSIQEAAFLLAKLNQPNDVIITSLDFLTATIPINYGPTEFARAVTIAKSVGFKNFNDCLHTAIAEQYCTDLYTCNSKDFSVIKDHTPLNIHFVR